MECSSNKRNPVDDYFAAFDAVLTSEDDSDEVPDTAARLPQRKRTQHSQATTIETPLPSDDEDVPLVKNRRGDQKVQGSKDKGKKRATPIESAPKRKRGRPSNAERQAKRAAQEAAQKAATSNN
ncbi:hypothetical protein BJV82DRAFT_588080 [Fennellomyces sp. T-0311]|nr:hypothetical protein BJV82DRAFT_641331 [Fennellomyces sp. T-0311]KAI8144871.1 hypothetical protein BJV82DRAFT_606542 [Fennellomyces sp. T-0311]KAI8148392.1 hypothetical protein BJV82DRAFT_591977 [Fennellomyces sp. T-0311]KAI8149444.1 hypothetical protein BJV82DRAFT_588080 [Fennellomyces sp. T-0311]